MGNVFRNASAAPTSAIAAAIMRITSKASVKPQPGLAAI
jgi:hypothetical protein